MNILKKYAVSIFDLETQKHDLIIVTSVNRTDAIIRAFEIIFPDDPFYKDFLEMNYSWLGIILFSTDLGLSIEIKGA